MCDWPPKTTALPIQHSACDFDANKHPYNGGEAVPQEDIAQESKNNFLTDDSAIKEMQDTFCHVAPGEGRRAFKTREALNTG